MSIVIDYVRTLIPVNWKSSPSGWISGNCPLCTHNGQTRPDTRGRGGFHFDGEKFQYNCFNCNFKTGWSAGHKITPRFKMMCSHFGASESDIQRLQLELLKEADVAELLLKQQKKDAPIIIDWKEASLPEDTQSICNYKGEVTPEFIKAVEYLHDRGFDVTDPRFMYSPSSVPGRMKNRFIIPFTYKGKIVGYTARWIGNTPDGMTKYFNQSPKNNFVYGLDRQTSDKNVVIVTEGQLDAIVTDGVAIGSNNINDDQANIIDSLQKRVILLADADSAGLKAINTAIERGWSVSFPEWEDCKDAADALKKYGRLYTVRSILDSAIDNATKIKVLAKQWSKK